MARLRRPWLTAADGDGGADALAWLDALLRSERWSLIVEGAWKQPAAIHLLEGRIALAGLRHHSRTAGQHGQRVLSLGDNMSELLAAEKGRASGRALCSIGARAAAHQIGCGLRWDRPQHQ